MWRGACVRSTEAVASPLHPPLKEFRDRSAPRSYCYDNDCHNDNYNYNDNTNSNSNDTTHILIIMILSIVTIVSHSGVLS